MMWKEFLTKKTYECGPSEAIIIPKGEVGKTKKALVGCMVPVLQYQDRIIIGHFGPRETEKAGIQIGNMLYPVIPEQVCMYHNSMTGDSFRSYRANEYLSLFEKMLTLIANITHVSPDTITRRSYPTFSDVHIDWSKSNDPKIYHLPSASDFKQTLQILV